MPEREYYVWDKQGEEDEEWVKFFHFSESYRKAFLTLLQKEEMGTDSVYNDEDILPVLMCFSQYLELIFKALIIRAGKSIKKLNKGTKGHSPLEAYNEVIKIYPDFKLSKNAVYFINDFDWINEFGQSLRYPVSSRGKRLWIHNMEGRHFRLSGISAIGRQVISEIYLYLKNKIFGNSQIRTIETKLNGSKAVITRVKGKVFNEKRLTQEEFDRFMNN